MKTAIEKIREARAAGGWYGVNGDAILELDARLSAVEKRQGKDDFANGESPSEAGSIPSSGATAASPAASEDGALIDGCAEAMWNTIWPGSRWDWPSAKAGSMHSIADRSYFGRGMACAIAHLRSLGWGHYRELNAKIAAAESERDALKAELAARLSKPARKFRTRRVTKEDAVAVRGIYLAAKNPGKPEKDMMLALRACGFRVRVEEAKP